MNILILGAGISGMTFAIKLKELDSANKLKVIIIEKEDRVGGLVNSRTDGEYWFDNGCYYFYSRDPIAKKYSHLFSEVKEFSSRVWVNGKFFNFPFNPSEILRSVSFSKKVGILASIIKGNIGMMINKPTDSREWLNQRLGKSLVSQTGLDTYIEKLQTEPPRHIDNYMCTSRLNALDKNLFQQVKGKLLPKKAKQPSTVKKLYPRGGVRNISLCLEKRCLELGVEIKLNSTINKIDCKDRSYILNVDGNKITGDQIISTIPIPELIKLTNLDLNKDLYEYSKHYITNLLLEEVSVKEAYFMIYSFSKKHLWKRLTGIKMDDNKISMVIETNVKADTQLDLVSHTKHVIDSLIDDLELFTKNSIISDSTTVVSNSYPIFKKSMIVEHEQNLKIIKEQTGILLTGREAEFKYYSSVDATNSAEKLAINLYDKLKEII